MRGRHVDRKANQGGGRGRFKVGTQRCRATIEKDGGGGGETARGKRELEKKKKRSRTGLKPIKKGNYDHRQGSVLRKIERDVRKKRRNHRKSRGRYGFCNKGKKCQKISPGEGRI